MEENFKNIDEQRSWNNDNMWSEGGHEWSKSFGTTENLWNTYIFDDVKEFRGKKILEIAEWKGKQIGKCSCGFMRTAGISIQREEQAISKSKIGLGISENNIGEGFNFTCNKCGHGKADAKDLGEILGNEKSVTLFTCLKCGNVERK